MKMSLQQSYKNVANARYVKRHCLETAVFDVENRHVEHAAPVFATNVLHNVNIELYS